MFFPRSSIYLAIAIGVMVELNWKLAVLVICFAPVPAIIAAFATPERTRRERAYFTSTFASTGALTRSCRASSPCAASPWRIWRNGAFYAKWSVRTRR